MKDQTVQERLEEKSREYGEDCQAIIKILEEGENKDNGNRNSLFYNEEVMPDAVVKMFYGEHPERIREKIDNTHDEYFPDAEVRVCDTSELSNPEVYVKEKNAVVVVEDMSKRSVIDSEKGYKSVMEKTTQFVDRMVREGQIIDDFKLEEIHDYDDGLKYVDFEDKRAIENWPLLTDPSTVSEVTTKMATMYANLAAGLCQTYEREILDLAEAETENPEGRKDPIQYVKDDVAKASEEINDEVYDNSGFVPEMVGSWTYGQ